MTLFRGHFKVMPAIHKCYPERKTEDALMNQTAYGFLMNDTLTGSVLHFKEEGQALAFLTR